MVLLYRMFRDTNASENHLKQIQAALVIRGLFICEFAYSHLKNDGTYLPRITRETCNVKNLQIFLTYQHYLKDTDSK